MAAGMLASDLVRRMLAGEDISESLDHMLSQDNLRDVAFSAALFMAAEGGIGKAEALGARVPGAAGWVCSMPFRKLARQSLVFMLAEEMDRDLRAPAEKVGVLTPRAEREFRELGITQRAAVERALDRAMIPAQAIVGTGRRDQRIANYLGERPRAAYVAFDCATRSQMEARHCKAIGPLVDQLSRSAGKSRRLLGAIIQGKALLKTSEQCNGDLKMPTGASVHRSNYLTKAFGNLRSV